jgi:hypothetical protein
MRVNLTGRNQDDTGRWGVGENQSRRDLAKVAQHEVLGNEAQRHVRPARGR